MKKLHIHLGERSYDIHIASGLLDRVGEEIEKVCPKARRLAVVTDTNVDPLYSERVTKSMEAAGFYPAVFTAPAGEVTRAMRLGNRGMGFLCSSSKRPWAASLAFSSSKAAWRSPTPSAARLET